MKLESKIGLPGAIAIVVGGVIGMGVYALIPIIAAKSGNAAWLAILIAMVISLLGVLPVIQLSSALPVAGGGYNYGSRLLNPMAGMLVSWWGILGGASSVCVVAIGLADLVQPLLPFQISLHLLAAGLIAVFYVVYLFGVQLLTTLQIIMSLQMLLALGIYAAAPLFKTGVTWQVGTDFEFEPFIIAVILSFNVSLGFQVISELGEDIKNPKRNIPLALFIGAVVILLIYMGITFSYEGLVGLENLASFSEQNAPLIQTSKTFLPEWAVWFLGLGAVNAGLTSFNAGAIALPREIWAQARDLALPASFAKINPRTQSPLRAVSLFFGMVIALLLFGQLLDLLGFFSKEPFLKVINFYGLMAAIGIMFLTIIISFSALRLPRRYPLAYRQAAFRLSRPMLVFLVILSIVSSLGFTLILFNESWLVPFIYLVYTLLVVAYFYGRKRYLARQNIELGTYFSVFAEEAH